MLASSGKYCEGVSWHAVTSNFPGIGFLRSDSFEDPAHTHHLVNTQGIAKRSRSVDAFETSVFACGIREGIQK